MRPRCSRTPRTARRRTAGSSRPSITWRDLEWIAERRSCPSMLKGILTREDAALAVEHGAAGIIVSNHGGRQLDGVAGDARRAGGGRRGGRRPGRGARSTAASAAAPTRVKALALGAQAVLVGRPPIWGLAVDGEARRAPRPRAAARRDRARRSPCSAARGRTRCRARPRSARGPL